MASAQCISRQFLDKCPGWWYGCNPGTFGDQGSVTVATESVVQAIDWLRRRRCVILETRPGAYGDCKDHGISISFVRKGGANV